MNATDPHRSGSLRRLQRAGLLCAALAVAAAGLARADRPASAAAVAVTSQTRSDDVFATTVAYVEQFYPLWFTYYQSQYASENRLVGPDRVSPLYQIVVAINVDTLYASTFVDLSIEPLVLSVPATSVAYSVLNLDPYGDIFASGIPSQTPGTTLPAATYLLTPPGYTGAVPPGLVQIEMPLDFTSLIFRGDKFAPDGVDQVDEANAFRQGISTETLCEYENLPCPSGSSNGGATLILPEVAFAVPFKTAADGLIVADPISFLAQLQSAVASSNTPPMTPAVQALSDEFNRLFGDGQFSVADEPRRAAFASGARAAHQAILDRYLTNRGPTNWIHFTDIGDWGDDVVARSAITEFLQYGNGIATAAYYHAFRDGRGAALDSSNHGYVLTFPPGGQPEASRFWSLTAYTPQSVELVRNPADKYVIGSYTSGLEYHDDGSLSLYLSSEKPPGVAEANWLPVPSGPFNVMLRVYGVVQGSSVANDTYVPPAIVSLPGGAVPIRPGSGQLPIVRPGS